MYNVFSRHDNTLICNTPSNNLQKYTTNIIYHIIIYDIITYKYLWIWHKHITRSLYFNFCRNNSFNLFTNRAHMLQDLYLDLFLESIDNWSQYDNSVDPYLFLRLKKPTKHDRTWHLRRQKTALHREMLAKRMNMTELFHNSIDVKCVLFWKFLLSRFLHIKNRTIPIPSLLIPWLFASPGHQVSLYSPFPCSALGRTLKQIAIVRAILVSRNSRKYN